MSVHHSKLSNRIKICRGKSIPNYKNNFINIQNGKIEYNNEKIMENIPNIKMDYANNYFFRNNDEYYDYKYNYYNSIEENNEYNRESSSSYITSDYDDMYINYFPNKINYNYNYNDNYNKRISSPQITKSPLINNYLKISNPEIDNCFYENSYNDENLNIYYENEENKNEMINYDLKKGNRAPYSPKCNYNKNIYPPPNINNNKQIEMNNQNILSKSINQNIQFLNEKNMNFIKKKKNKKNVNNNTTNNTYNNNIYYINNPINVNNNKKIKEKNNILNNNFNNYNNLKCKKFNSKGNLIYKSVDFSNNKKENNINYFIINKKYRSKKDIILKAIILIQRVFRGYLLKIRLYNNVNLYICCKRGVYILDHLFLCTKKKLFYKFKKIIYSNKIRKSISSPFSIKEKSKSNSCLKFYNINNKKKVGRSSENNSKNKSINIFRQELRDSFNILFFPKVGKKK